MRRALVEARKQRAGFGRHDGQLIVCAGKFPDGLERIERHDGHEFHAIRQRATQQLDAAKSLDRTIANADEDLLVKQSFVRIRIRAGGPPMPDPHDHFGAPPPPSGQCLSGRAGGGWSASRRSAWMYAWVTLCRP